MLIIMYKILPLQSSLSVCHPAISRTVFINLPAASIIFMGAVNNFKFFFQYQGCFWNVNYIQAAEMARNHCNFLAICRHIREDLLSAQTSHLLAVARKQRLHLGLPLAKRQSLFKSLLINVYILIFTFQVGTQSACTNQ
jgi:hypothetical protein